MSEVPGTVQDFLNREQNLGAVRGLRFAAVWLDSTIADLQAYIGEETKEPQ